jgi:hypothetical protein
VIVTFVVVIVTFVIVIVLGCFFGSTALRLERTAAFDTTAAGISGTRTRAHPTRLRVGRAQLRQLCRGVTRDDHRDVARALANAHGAPACSWAPALERGAFVGVARRHEQLFGGQAGVVLGIGDRRVETLLDDARDTALGELEDLTRAPVGFAANEIEHLACLVGGYASVAHMRTDAGAFVGLIAESH